MGTEKSNKAAHLECQNVIKHLPEHGSKSSTKSFFHKVSFGAKCDIWFDHFVSLSSKPGILPGAVLALSC